MSPRKCGEAVGAGDQSVLIAIRPLPSTLVNEFVEASLRVEPRSNHVEAAGGAARSRSASQAPRPSGCRATTATARLARRSFAAHLPGTSHGLASATCPLKPPLKPPGAFRSKSDRTERGSKRDAAVGNIQNDVGQRERLVRWRREQPVDLAPADLAMDQPPAKPHASRDDPVDFEAAVPLQPHLDDAHASRRDRADWDRRSRAR